MPTISGAPVELFGAIVQDFKRRSKDFNEIQRLVAAMLAEAQTECSEIHSYRTRTKDPAHLEDKLHRRWKKSVERGENFDLTVSNYVSKINDLVGGRVLHLHSRQFESIHKAILRALSAQTRGWTVKGGRPEAKVWDPEYREYFRSLGVKNVEQDLYTSVHYEVLLPKRGPVDRFSFELQVRTLAEELWGETDHQINYPHKTGTVALSEQLRALARATSTCTRLVDSIMRTREQDGQPAVHSVAAVKPV